MSLGAASSQALCLVPCAFLFLRIHPPDVIGKYAPDSVIGMIGGGGGGAVAAGAPAAGGGGGISMAEVAKHNSKSDCWVSWFLFWSGIAMDFMITGIITLNHYLHTLYTSVHRRYRTFFDTATEILLTAPR